MASPLTLSRLVAVLCVLFSLAGCGASVTRGEAPRILAMGDSLLAWNRTRGRSIPDMVEAALGEPVLDRSVLGARMIYALPITGAMGMNIAKQYRKGSWDWVILNGGGNDLWLGCGCARCAHRIERMISEDGRNGRIPDLVRHLRAAGARVIYTGYLRSPGRGSLIEHCREEGRVFEGRIARMATAVEGVYFLSLEGLVPHGDRSYHAFDMIHPSVKASREIGARIAGIIREVGDRRARAGVPRSEARETTPR